MSMSDSFTYFVDSIFGPLVFVIGMTGNIISLIVLTNAKLKNIGPLYMYRFLFIADSIYLPQIIITYMGTGFNYNPKILSSLGCKVYQYFSYALDAVSPWVLVYISVEKFISISYPQAKFAKLRRKSVQFKSMIFLSLFAGVYYIAQPLCYELINTGSLNQTHYRCTYINDVAQQVSSLMDTVHRVILPFSLMFVFSILLIGSIFMSRYRVHDSLVQDKRLKRDIRFAISSFSMNLLFVILNLPMSVIEIIPNASSISFYTTLYLFFFSYGVNFYVLFFTNSIFRKNCIDLFINKHSKKENVDLKILKLKENETKF
jgi:hypothetical protein